MRFVIVLLGTLVSGVASAQSVPNGSFETGDLTDWTDASSGVCIGGGGGFCEDGEAYAISEYDAGITIPDGDYGVALYTGDQTGWTESFGRAESSSFLVTRVELQWRQAVEDERFGLELVIYDSAGAEVGRTAPQPSVGTLAIQSTEVAAACGSNISIAVAAYPAEADWQAISGVALFDQFQLGGDPCDMFLDEDGDGFCPNGVDLDGNGDCADDGEPTLDQQDCDEGDPGVNPDAVDIADNGVDEDCDGVDATSGGSGTGTGGTATGSTGGTATGGSGTGTGTGGIDPNATTDGDGEIEEIKATGAGCGCTTGGAPSAAWLVLLLPFLRRR